MPSKLEQLQRQYRRQLLQEKEERMIKIHTESQQKALSKVARYNGLSMLPTTTAHNPKPPVGHHSPVKKGSPGVDRSRPLPPISKDGTATRSCASSYSAPADNGKVPAASAATANSGWRSRSVDAGVDSRLGPPRGLPANDPSSRVVESSFEFETSRQVVVESAEMTSRQVVVESAEVTSRQVVVESAEARPARVPEPASRPADPKPAAAAVDRKASQQDAITRLKQAELQRLRAKVREEPPTPRQNGFSSDTFTRSSNAQKKPAAKPPAPSVTASRPKPSFLNATASSSRKAAPGPAAARPVAGKAAAPVGGAHRPPPGPGQEQCRTCGRNFNTDRIAKHASICQKAAQKKVKVFDATKMRVKGTEAEQFVKKGTVQKAPEPKAKQSNWRKKHNEFIEAIRQAKVMQQHLAKGGKVSDLPPPPPSDTSDYVQCPYCERKFNEGVAERHIPKCKNILSNKKNPGPARKK